MDTPTLTIFSNFRINDEERFLRMKDSFMSFKDIDAVKWVINVRGKYKKETLSFLGDHLKEKLSSHLIESGKGWFHDTRQLLPEINTDFILYWVEDHINMVTVEKYPFILKELKASGSQFLFSSWWVFDQKQNAYEDIPRESYDNIDTMLIDRAAAEKINRRDKLHFIISLAGLFRVDLFKKIVSTNHPKLRRWPKEIPFDVEKRLTDYQWLPLKVSLPKYELFAPIDDDLRGYVGCLQSRGLYPLRVLRSSEIPEMSRWKSVLKKKYDILPSGVKWILRKALLNPYLKVEHLLRRISYHF
jgi:hypothetical protein